MDSVVVKMDGEWSTSTFLKVHLTQPFMILPWALKHKSQTVRQSDSGNLTSRPTRHSWKPTGSEL